MVFHCLTLQGHKRVEEITAEAEMLLQRYEKAWSELDAEGVAALFAEDGMFLVPGMDVIRGRKGATLPWLCMRQGL